MSSSADAGYFLESNSEKHPSLKHCRCLPNSKVNLHAQVLDRNEQAIAVLYTAGGDMATVRGGHYPAGGINLGPALTFDYIAARHIAGITAFEQEIDHAAHR